MTAYIKILTQFTHTLFLFALSKVPDDAMEKEVLDMFKKLATAINAINSEIKV